MLLCIAHRHADARRLEHRNIVFAVADGEDLVRPDVQSLRQFQQNCALVRVLRHDLYVDEARARHKDRQRLDLAERRLLCRRVGKDHVEFIHAALPRRERRRQRRDDRVRVEHALHLRGIEPRELADLIGLVADQIVIENADQRVILPENGVDLPRRHDVQRVIAQPLMLLHIHQKSACAAHQIPDLRHAVQHHLALAEVAPRVQRDDHARRRGPAQRIRRRLRDLISSICDRPVHIHGQQPNCHTCFLRFSICRYFISIGP